MGQMAEVKVMAAVAGQRSLTEDVFDLWITAPEIAKRARPGQFISVYSKDGSRLLPRPISICQTHGDSGRLRIVYRVAGKGTREFSHYRTGDSIEIMGPLGNGFPLEAGGTGKKALLIAGGIGIPPMLELARRLEGEKQMVLGYRDELFLDEEFDAYGHVYLATETGRSGTQGNVMDVIREYGLKADTIYACGPTPMLKAIKTYAIETGTECYLSLEEKMACGIGACLACVCQSKDVDSHSMVHNKRICKDGPVFRAEEVEL